MTSITAQAAKHQAMIEEAAEFGERFPDAADHDIIEHISFVFRRPIHPESCVANACIAAYDHGVAAGEAHIRAFFGG